MPNGAVYAETASPFCDWDVREAQASSAPVDGTRPPAVSARGIPAGTRAAAAHARVCRGGRGRARARVRQRGPRSVRARGKVSLPGRCHRAARRRQRQPDGQRRGGPGEARGPRGRCGGGRSRLSEMLAAGRRPWHGLLHLASPCRLRRGPALALLVRGVRLLWV